ncbi:MULTISPECIES: hypothetical protein [unclassified Neisseria]|uniref:hypothetical protein n=1 Tax=unclassified Neisseria TaxID=2623750 RepID=UPI0010717CD2|nr:MULTISPECIES: hypothetical protein [unclassified Neisseria]MBF0802969.1 hypothetical protein [Neisseria sp. 19428wB4_WF04]TFU44496.1 hypothetical protein E4T99_01050 [Neisseria sp. WF04]
MSVFRLPVPFSDGLGCRDNGIFEYRLVLPPHSGIFWQPRPPVGHHARNGLPLHRRIFQAAAVKFQAV